MGNPISPHPYSALPGSLPGFTMPRAKKPRAERTNMNLPHSTRALARIAGDGDRTAGVERLFAQLPVFYQVQRYLEQRAATGDDQASALLHEMAGLEYERIYQEAVAEGVIVVHGADGNTAAWIV